MDKNKIISKIKKIAVLLVVLLVVWFLILGPIIKFKSNENKMLEASKRFFEVNSNLLPTGSRVKTIYLKDLYSKAFLKEDLYTPISGKACSISDSWVKVKRENGVYKYYSYLKCGVMNSLIDHKGPEIVLNGSDTVVINKGDKYPELGVKSVNDNKDGKLDLSEVSIRSSKVNTNKVGTYEVIYTAFDKLNNKTEKIRTVKVVSTLKNVVSKSTNGKGYYKGENPNNFVYFSGMLFRIIGIKGNDIKIIADQDISNVNYDGINKWLDYYYDHLKNSSKKLIVPANYCNMKINDNSTNTTKCNSYTNKKNVYIASIDEVNKSLVNNESFMKSKSISWLSNKLDNKKAYAVRDVFYGEESNKNAITFNKNYNYGVRPVITIKGDSRVKEGKGTYEDPYNLGDFKRAKDNQKLNKRYTGEYIEYSNYLWRIIDVDSDGTTKVILDNTIKSNGENVETFYKTSNKSKIYNPKQKDNVGYFINNKTSRYLKTDYFVKKQISVPIYKGIFKYKKEIGTKKYKAKLFAPNMYEMFSAYTFEYQSGSPMGSYWMINSSKKQYKKSVVTDIGYMVNEDLGDYLPFGIRLSGYLNKDLEIVSGEGTKENPYKIAK